MEKIVFLDRDGTINEEVSYLYQPEKLVFLEGVAQALSQLKQAGFRLVVISNQAGVARGYYSEEQVDQLHRFMNRKLQPLGAELDGFYYCPHHPVHGLGPYLQDCECRKPGIGLFLQAEAQFQVDKSRSFMIGDKLIDVEAGKRYGVCSVLVGSGYGSQYEQKERQRQQTEPLYSPPYDYYAKDIKEAARWIIEQDKKEI